MSLGLVSVASAQATAPATATPPPPTRITPAALDPLVAEALARNSRLARERLGRQQTAADRDAARGRRLPALALEGRYSELSGVVNIGDFINPAYATLNDLVGAPRFPTDINATLPFRHQSFLRLTQPLFNPAIRAGVDAADALHALQDANVDGTGRLIAADVQRAALACAAATQVAELRATVLPVLREYLRSSERQLTAGLLTPDAVLRARAELAEASQAQDDAARDRDDACRVVNLLLERDLDSTLTLPAALLDLPPLTLSDADLHASAMARRAELRQLDQGARVIGAQSRLAQAAFLPSVALAVDYGVQGDRLRLSRDEDFAVASVVVSWNLFNGGQDAARRQRAQLEADRQALDRRAAVRSIALELQTTLSALRSAARADSTAAQRVDAARSAFTLTARRFDEGLASPLDFLSARAALTAAELNAVITRHSHVLRRIELERVAALRPLLP